MDKKTELIPSSTQHIQRGCECDVIPAAKSAAWTLAREGAGLGPGEPEPSCGPLVQGCRSYLRGVALRSWRVSESPRGLVRTAC